MNATVHPVAPEEVMSFLDGELCAADAQVISTHIDQCVECNSLAEQLRSTSQSLSRWNVETVPKQLEDSVTCMAAKGGSGTKTGKANLFIRTSFWTWKQWAVGVSAAGATLLLLIAVATPNLMRTRVARQSVAVARRRAQKSEREGSGRNLGKLEVDGQPITDQQSKVFQGGPGAPAPPNSPGVAADSNGFFHGLGDHAQNSFVVGGQLITDQQNKGSSNSTPAPMIAHSVSLAIVVKDFAAARSSLDAILARHHGYSAQLGVSTPENAPRGLQASLRIPAPGLSSAVADLKTLGRVENESQSGEEVTQQHTDLIARLKNSRDTEQRLRTILQQRPGKVAEVLQVEEEIARVRGDIERMEAEQKALEHRVDFATVELQLTEEYKAQLNPPAASVSTRIHNAFVAGYRSTSETLLGIVLFFAEYGPTLLVWLLILIPPITFVWRRYRKALTPM